MKTTQSDERLSAALRELAAGSAQHPSAEAGLVLKEAFRRHHLHRKQLLRIRAGMICICLVGLLLSLLLRRSSPDGNSGDTATMHIIPPEEVSHPSEVSASRTSTRQPVSARRASANPNRPAATSGFVALPAFDMFRPGDELRIVRLEMGGEDLRLVGAPVTEEIAARRITADFVVGHDGTPYAMRLVRSNF